MSLVTDGQSATVSVSDEGIGLDRDELGQMFRRGYRAAPARRVKGDGLGLYLARGLVQKHGGRLWAESPGRGQGSTFSFTLPLADEQIIDRAVERSA